MENEKTEKTFAEKLKEVRKTLGITQQQFADACGLARKQISYYETGEDEPSLLNLRKIIKAFHINPNQFF